MYNIVGNAWDSRQADKQAKAAKKAMWVIAGYCSQNKCSTCSICDEDFRDYCILPRIIVNFIEKERKWQNNGKDDILYDLAGEARHTAPPDLADYIMDDELPSARVALRKAKAAGVSDDFWQKVIEMIEKDGRDNND